MIGSLDLSDTSFIIEYDSTNTPKFLATLTNIKFEIPSLNM